MIRRIALILLLAAAAAWTVGAIEIHQTIPPTSVYVGDVLDLTAFWPGDIAYWAPNHDPSVDPPDRIVNVTNRRAFTVTQDMPLGVWWVWIGRSERSPTDIFRLKGGDRPAGNLTPTPTPTPLPEVKGIQPLPMADYLIARGSPFRFTCSGPCRVWLFGPEAVLGQEGPMVMNTTLLPGPYHLLAQYPDPSGTYEVFSDGEALNSTWKSVAAVWIKAFPPALIEDRLNGLLGDPAHFHGKVERKTLQVEEPHVEITAVGETEKREVMVSGLTNLPEGARFPVVFNDDQVVLKEDRLRNTVIVTAIGPDPGAPRVWNGTLTPDLQALHVGNHQVSAYPPGGAKSSVEVYISETFEPFTTPAPVTRYLAGDPFLPTPTPIVVEREVPVTVIQTVVVNVTPPHEEVVRAQLEAEEIAMDELKGEILFYGAVLLALVVLGYFMFRVGKYLRGAIQRARTEGGQHGTY